MEKKKMYIPFTSKGLLNNIYNINVEEDTVALKEAKVKPSVLRYYLRCLEAACIANNPHLKRKGLKVRDWWGNGKGIHMLKAYKFEDKIKDMGKLLGENQVCSITI